MMESSKQIQTLQMAYAGALADAVLQLSKEGVLSKVIVRKRQEQFVVGKMRAAQFGIASPEEVFRKLSELFGCAQWDIVQRASGGFVARTGSCMLCALTKKIGAPSPCQLYCLDPMEALVKALKSDAAYSVEETLWDGRQCLVRVT